MTETPGHYHVDERTRPQKNSFDTQLQALPPDVRSVALYLTGNRGKS